jgi:hypothetical protein
VSRGAEQGNEAREARAKERESLSMTGAEAEGAFDSKAFVPDRSVWEQVSRERAARKVGMFQSCFYTLYTFRVHRLHLDSRLKSVRFYNSVFTSPASSTPCTYNMALLKAQAVNIVPKTANNSSKTGILSPDPCNLPCSHCSLLPSPTSGKHFLTNCSRSSISSIAAE